MKGQKIEVDPEGATIRVRTKCGQSLLVDGRGAALCVSPFQVKIPDVSRMGLWPASVGFSEEKRAAWLDTLELVQLRALQGRLRAWGECAYQKRQSEGGSRQLDDACKAMDADSQMIVDAIGRWLDRNP